MQQFFTLFSFNEWKLVRSHQICIDVQSTVSHSFLLAFYILDLITNRRDNDIISSFCTPMFSNVFARFGKIIIFDIWHIIRYDKVMSVGWFRCSYIWLSDFRFHIRYCLKPPNIHSLIHQLSQSLVHSVQAMKWIHPFDDYYYHVEWQLAVSYSEEAQTNLSFQLVNAVAIRKPFEMMRKC